MNNNNIYKELYINMIFPTYESGVIMSNYEQIKIKLHNALLTGLIDANFYHIAMKQIDGFVKCISTEHSYTDSSLSFAPVK